MSLFFGCCGRRTFCVCSVNFQKPVEKLIRICYTKIMHLRGRSFVPFAPLCRKIIAEGELDNGDGQADVHVKVRRLPNYDFRFIGRLQLQRNTKQGIERGMFYAKVVVKCLTLRCVGDGVTACSRFSDGVG